MLPLHIPFKSQQDFPFKTKKKKQTKTTNEQTKDVEFINRFYPWRKFGDRETMRMRQQDRSFSSGVMGRSKSRVAQFQSSLNVLLMELPMVCIFLSFFSYKLDSKNPPTTKKKHLDSQFQQAFLLTFRAFMKPETLLKLMIERYLKSSSDQGPVDLSQPIRLRFPFLSFPNRFFFFALEQMRK